MKVYTCHSSALPQWNEQPVSMTDSAIIRGRYTLYTYLDMMPQRNDLVITALKLEEQDKGNAVVLRCLANTAAFDREDAGVSMDFNSRVSTDYLYVRRTVIIILLLLLLALFVKLLTARVYPEMME